MHEVDGIAVKDIVEIVHVSIKSYLEAKAGTSKERHEQRRKHIKHLLSQYRSLIATDSSEAVRLDFALDYFKTHYDNSSKPEEVRRFRVIFWRYLASDRKSVSDIAEGECVDSAQITRDTEYAIDYIMPLFFGIDGLDLQAKMGRKYT